MSWQEDASARIYDLIQQGEGVSVRGRGSEYETLDYATFHAWRTRTLVALQQLIGPDSTSTKEVGRIASGSSSVGNRDGRVAILRSLQEDVKRGYLRRVADLISAEV